MSLLPHHKSIEIVSLEHWDSITGAMLPLHDSMLPAIDNYTKRFIIETIQKMAKDAEGVSAQ